MMQKYLMDCGNLSKANQRGTRERKDIYLRWDAYLAQSQFNCPTSGHINIYAAYNTSRHMFGGIFMENYVQQILSIWEGNPLEGADEMIQKYVYPQEASVNKITWYNNGPWKRTVVYRETVPHNFPTPHPDFLEQTIDYRVPIH